MTTVKIECQLLVAHRFSQMGAFSFTGVGGPIFGFYFSFDVFLLTTDFFLSFFPLEVFKMSTTIDRACCLFEASFFIRKIRLILCGYSKLV